MACKDLQEAYELLTEAGLLTVEGIVDWLQDSNIIEKTKESGQKVTTYFVGVTNNAPVTCEQFKEAVCKVATKQRQNVEDLSKRLLEYGKKVLRSAKDGAHAGAVTFKESMHRKNE